MWVNGFIKWKTNDLIPHRFLFKHGKIQEVENENFKGIKAFENNSTLADNFEIFKTYKKDESNNHSKYYIKKSVDNEVFLIFLKINIFQYWRLKWQLKENIIQSKEFIRGLYIAIIVFVLGIFGFYIKETIKDKRIESKTETVVEPKSISKEPIKSDLKKDSLQME